MSIYSNSPLDCKVRVQKITVCQLIRVTTPSSSTRATNSKIRTENWSPQKHPWGVWLSLKNSLKFAK